MHHTSGQPLINYRAAMRDEDFCTLVGALFWGNIGFIYLLEQEAFQECKRVYFLSVQGVSDPMIRKRNEKNRLDEVRFAKY